MRKRLKSKVMAIATLQTSENLSMGAKKAFEVFHAALHQHQGHLACPNRFIKFGVFNSATSLSLDDHIFQQWNFAMAASWGLYLLLGIILYILPYSNNKWSLCNSQMMHFYGNHHFVIINLYLIQYHSWYCDL